MVYVYLLSCVCHGSVTCWLVCHGVRVLVGLCVMVYTCWLVCCGSVTCWLVCHGVYLLACVSWCVLVGLCVMVCTCWLVCHGVYLLACVSWCVLVGLCHGCVLGLCIKVACVMGVYLSCASRRWLVSWVCT